MTLPKRMSGVLLTGHGGPDKLQWSDDIPVPDPGPGQVLVRVLAAGVNNTDINTRLGWYAREVTGATDQATGDGVQTGGWDGALAFPRIQGGDLCGAVVALGDGVTTTEIGRRVTAPLCLPRPSLANPVGIEVLGSERDGAFAQYCLLEQGDLCDVTTSPLTDVEIAAIPCAYSTAEGMLARAGITSGQTVLITGASGGVGMAAVELATLRGARVTAMTSPAKADAVRAAGAVQTLDRGATLPDDGFDAAIDVVGGPGFASLITATRPGGHIAFAGAIAGPMAGIDLRDVYLRDITLHGCTFQAPEIFARLVALINAGRLKPLVSHCYPLAEIARAQKDFQSKAYPGKLVLIPPGADR
ncbi:alcohol dehydrogenase family protein [Seohaeicola saemankumensis]|nr:alcohol dehydrogenase family protein [Seohaeicola saemankumensis]MCA0873636.1 alcohol dehydrogenase family protein [Seohaeicola saemankumensis]